MGMNDNSRKSPIFVKNNPLQPPRGEANELPSHRRGGARGGVSIQIAGTCKEEKKITLPTPNPSSSGAGSTTASGVSTPPP